MKTWLCISDLFVFRWTTKQERDEARYLRAIERDLRRDRIAARLNERDEALAQGYRAGVTYKWIHKYR